MPPDEPASQRPLFGRMGGTVKKKGDLLAPMDLEWSAVSGEENYLYSGSPETHPVHRVAGKPKRRPK